MYTVPVCGTTLVDHGTLTVCSCHRAWNEKSITIHSYPEAWYGRSCCMHRQDWSQRIQTHSDLWVSSVRCVCCWFVGRFRHADYEGGLMTLTMHVFNLNPSPEGRQCLAYGCTPIMPCYQQTVFLLHFKLCQCRWRKDCRCDPELVRLWQLCSPGLCYDHPEAPRGGYIIGFE